MTKFVISLESIRKTFLYLFSCDVFSLHLPLVGHLSFDNSLCINSFFYVLFYQFIISFCFGGMFFPGILTVLEFYPVLFLSFA